MTNKIAYSVKEAVNVSSISRTTLYELIKAGKIKPAKIGTRTLIMRSDLEAMIQRAVAA